MNMKIWENEFDFWILYIKIRLHGTFHKNLRKKGFFGIFTCERHTKTEVLKGLMVFQRFFNFFSSILGLSFYFIRSSNFWWFLFYSVFPWDIGNNNGWSLSVHQSRISLANFSYFGNFEPAFCWYMTFDCAVVSCNSHVYTYAVCEDFRFQCPQFLGISPWARNVRKLHPVSNEVCNFIFVPCTP